ncbi:MAG TPA: rod shape-determining protein MreC [Kiloniellales bacterium]|nr:rod shape-determining protein MreC [Kiloniellales bacterium]
MKKPSGSLTHVTTPIRAWAQRFAFLFLVLTAFALMLLGKADTVVVERLRTTVTDAAVPVLELASEPVDTVRAMADNIAELANLRDENAALRREVERLQSWQATARRLEVENAVLRELANMTPDPGLRFVTARVVGDSGGAFARSVLINAGSRQGVAKGQAAVTAEGLAGRVAEVGERSARILLITDINSRVPVLVGPGRERAVLAGDNGPRPRLLYLAPGVTVEPGQRVVTSGHGGVFPPDLAIGVVGAPGDVGPRVQPFVDWAHMEYLRLADYELPRLLEREMLSGRTGATGTRP